MEENDPINLEYSAIVESMGEDTLEEFEKATFVADTEAAVQVFTKYADLLAEVFGPDVVTAALCIVHEDYETLLTEERD